MGRGSFAGRAPFSVLTVLGSRHSPLEEGDCFLDGRDESVVVPFETGRRDLTHDILLEVEVLLEPHLKDYPASASLLGLVPPTDGLDPDGPSVLEREDIASGDMDLLLGGHDLLVAVQGEEDLSGS